MQRTLQSKTIYVQNQKIFIPNRMQLGFGTFSKVFYAINLETLQEYAVKRVLKKDHFYLAQNEIMMYIVHLKGIGSIPKLFYVHNDLEYIYLFLECCKGVDLDVFLRREGYFLTELETFLLFQQMVFIVDKVHQKGISHRDIKLENFIFKSAKCFELCLIDFGFSDFIQKENSHSYGTLAYAAPELFNQKQLNNEKVDTWALGVCLYTLAIGDYPFDCILNSSVISYSEQSKIVASNIQNLEIKNYKKNTKFLSKELKTLLFQCLLIKDPTKRYNCKQILNSKWVKKMSMTVQKQNLTFTKLRALRQLHQP